MGRKPKPETNADSWVSNDRRALVMIRLRVADAVLIHIRRAETSAEAWNTLAKRFELKGVSAIIATRRKLFSAKYEEGTDISNFINMMFKNKEQLEILAHPLPEDEFSLLILTALGDSWDSFISTLKDSDPQNPIFLYMFFYGFSVHSIISARYDALSNFRAALLSVAPPSLQVAV